MTLLCAGGAGPLGQGERDSLEKGPSTPTHNPLSEISHLPSPSSVTALVLALVLSNSGKRINQAEKKKYMKQVTGRHNDTELHLVAQRGDVGVVK